MQVEFKVDQRSINNLMKQASKVGGNIARRVAQETAYAATEVEKLAKQNAPVGISGDLRSRMYNQKQTRSVKISRMLRGQAARVTHIVGTNLRYAAAVEFGSVPHWAPIAPLKLWAKRKLQDESAAYAVQKKIAKEGTKPQPFLRPAYRAVIPGYKAAIKRILRSAK